VFEGIHHAAIICSDYEKSRYFYVEILKLRVIAESYREHRQSHKLDLEIAPGHRIELFSFPNPPARPTAPEARGLRHLALLVPDIAAVIAHLEANGIPVEPLRVDELTDKRFTFFYDPDGLPLELYEK
jgi:glyoxylase I family protein